MEKSTLPSKSAVDFAHNLKLLQPTDDELQAHLELLKMINKKSGNNCLWDKRFSNDNVH